MFIVALLNSQDMEIKDMFLFRDEKKEILPFATAWMNLEGIILSEICQGRQILYGILCGIFGEKTHRNKIEWWLLDTGM